MRKNVLISTTRQWNPGDEFIMQGTLNILTEAFGDRYNPIIFNRNPDIRGGSKWRNPSRKMRLTHWWDKKNFRGKGILQEALRIGHFDNSYKDDMNPENIDLALFAGSPEWFGSRLIPMYEAIEAASIPTIFLGLGAGNRSAFSSAIPAVDRVLQKAKIITTRERDTEKLLEKYGAKYVPCPALLAANSNHVVTHVNRIGLIYATSYTISGNNVSNVMHNYLMKLFPEIIKRYDVGIVCHYIDELDQAMREFPGVDIYYSYDSKDYANIFKSFDLVIGGRVHGIGMGASLGIPGIMIRHDSRSKTTDGFLASSIDIGTPISEVIRLIEEMKAGKKVETLSLQLVEHKKNVMNRYVALLQEKLGGWN
ncbi:polysaccharide pyruvyl transferase family protein [Desulfosporosinus meridiei]|uniref:Polysaccharide pyruvyl transferase domain-containing protein n=1 Tax=Desulfosporosinus meridiei (strain ATCC BAA-275 / DSM 13257 / KCTC 12902 / NCIMB 13706 / S10) TaxID=768704 RepID=J7J3Y6_DESMD|nr:polysaccharide pyruvyl transferase family protein [Desulfosporosinus meridiei]AFQ45983.1 hypothetical protein Desmer_4154 [Desulfosporosinus meridiei DSM 13257]